MLPPVLAPIPENIPTRLTGCPQLALGRGKVPYQPTGRTAKSTDQATWCAFATARQTLAARPDQYDRLYYALGNGDGLTGIDIDHCVENGVVNAQGRYWIEHFRS